MSKSTVPPTSPQDSGTASLESEQDQISQNLGAVLNFYSQEDHKISRSQRILERISLVIGKPAYLGFILLGVLLWVGANLLLRRVGRTAFDPPPFFWLQGLIGLGALLTATVVLAKQNRFSKLAKQRAHLDLKVT